jgi:hypothetical protein
MAPARNAEVKIVVATRFVVGRPRREIRRWARLGTPWLNPLSEPGRRAAQPAKSGHNQYLQYCEIQFLRVMFSILAEQSQN